MKELLENETELALETVQGHWWVGVLGLGAGGTTSLTRNVMLGARDCHSTRRRSAGNAVGVPKCTCAQCGGMWGTRLDAQVSPDANLEGAVLEVSPGQEGWRGPGKRAAIALRSGRIAPLINSHRGCESFRECRVCRCLSQPQSAPGPRNLRTTGNDDT